MSKAKTAKPRIGQIPLDKLVVWKELDMFPNNPHHGVDVERDIFDSIKSQGFNPAEPIIAWKGAGEKGQHVIVDGHTRVRAAKRARQRSVSGVLMEFASLGEAQEYAFRRQKSRRNISVGTLALAGIAARESAKEKDKASTKELSQMWGISTAMIDWARNLARRGRPSEIQAVMDETISLKAAYKALKARENREAKAEERALLRKPEVEPEEDGSGGYDMSAEGPPEEDETEEYAAVRDATGDLMDEAGDLEHYLGRGERVTNPNVIEERLEVVEARFKDLRSAYKALVKARK